MLKHIKSDSAQARGFGDTDIHPRNRGNHCRRGAGRDAGDWLTRLQGRCQLGRLGASHPAVRELARTQLRPRGTPKAAITAVMRKLLLLANAADSKGQNVGCYCTDTRVRGAIAKANTNR